MTSERMENFCWFDFSRAEGHTSEENYQELVDWSREARGKNPNAFDSLKDWVLDDPSWSGGNLVGSWGQLANGLIGRFREQNAGFRRILQEMELPELVNPAVFPALDAFDRTLEGELPDPQLKEVVRQMLASPAAMESHSLRARIAGGKTGSYGTDAIEVTGYLNFLEDADAAVQWTLFMPGVVEEQQKGFRLERLSYRTLPAIRFLGREGEDLENPQARRELFAELDRLDQYRCGFDYDLFFMHHYGLCVDVGPWHGFWGRFFQAGAPVPEGFAYFDLVPENNGAEGPPFLSQFAFGVFSGSQEALHSRQGFDSDAMYDVTRNAILGQGVLIPYPHKYWTAEVFLQGWEQGGTGYLFSVDREAQPEK